MAASRERRYAGSMTRLARYLPTAIGTVVLATLSLGCETETAVAGPCTSADPPALLALSDPEAPPEGPFDGATLSVLRGWIAAHPERRPTTVTTQSGFSDPAPFEGSDWTSELRAFRQAWEEVLGPIPTSCVPLDAREEPLTLTAADVEHLRWIQTVQNVPDPADFVTYPVPDGPGRGRLATAHYELRKISYRGAHRDRIRAYLLVPNGPPPAGGKRPAILVMHQAQPACGKDEPVGLCGVRGSPGGEVSGVPWLDFARDLADMGFIVLAPDSVGFGERAHTYWDSGQEYTDAYPILRRFPHASVIGVKISDVMRGIDWLAAEPEVDPQRIGMMGHSNGGIETVFAAAFDTRIRAAIANGGPNLIRRTVAVCDQTGDGLSLWAGFGYLPTLGFYEHDHAAMPVEIHQLYALVSPRSLFIANAEDDTTAPNFDRIDWASHEAARVFQALGGDFAWDTIASTMTPECLAANPDCFAIACRSNHGWYPQTEARAYPWLLAQLGPTR